MSALVHTIPLIYEMEQSHCFRKHYLSTSFTTVSAGGKKEFFSDSERWRARSFIRWGVLITVHLVVDSRAMSAVQTLERMRTASCTVQDGVATDLVTSPLAEDILSARRDGARCANTSVRNTHS